MGGPISSIIADIVLNNMESKIISKFANSISFYRRFVDDCLLACHEKDIIAIVEEFNNFYNRIQFTLEKEKHKQINFLDMTIYNRGRVLSTSWYTKPIWTQRYTNYFSCIPRKYKISVVYGLLDRAILLSDKEFHPTNINKVRDTLKLNNYPANFINKFINKRMKKYKHTNRTSDGNAHDNQRLYMGFTYLPDVTDMISKQFLTNTNKIICPKKYNTLNKLVFTNLKAKTPQNMKANLIYKISCGDCEACYIGQTKNFLQNRIATHKRSISKGLHDTALARHAINELHRFNFDDIKILNYDINLTSRLIKEMIYIKKEINSVNSHEDVRNLSVIYNNLIRNIR